MIPSWHKVAETAGRQASSGPSQAGNANDDAAANNPPSARSHNANNADEGDGRNTASQRDKMAQNILDAENKNWFCHPSFAAAVADADDGSDVVRANYHGGRFDAGAIVEDYKVVVRPEKESIV
jgi:hypothetical protein